MKSFRSTMILIVAAVLVWGLIYVLNRIPAKPKDDSSKKNQKVFDNFVADDIAEIRLENVPNTTTAQKTFVDLQKDGNNEWQITAPKKYKADDSAAQNMLTGAGSLVAESTIDNAANLADFGLNSPVAHCSFLPKKGPALEFFIGDKSPTGVDYYVKTPGKSGVFLVTSYTMDQYRKALNEYRDKSFFKTDSVLAQKVKVTYEGKRFVFEKDKDSHWHITEPAQARADDSKVRDLLNQVNNLRVTEFIDDHPAGLAPYGLSAPRAEVEVLPEKGPSRAILVGREKLKANTYFAKDRDQPFVSTIPEYFVKNLDIKADDYRDKTAMRFDAGLAKTLTVLYNGKTFSYQKDAKGQWNSDRPKGAEEAMNLVSQLAGTSISNFVTKKAASGLDEPSVTAKVDLADGTSRVYKFGKREKDQVYLASDANKDVYLVAAGVVAQMENYYNPPAPMPAASPASPAKK